METPKTPRGQEYKDQYLERASTTLFIPRTSKGEPDLAALNRTRELADRFASWPQFVAATARGSRMKGYSKESDTDIALFFTRLSEKYAEEMKDVGASIYNLDPVIDKLDRLVKKHDTALSNDEYDVIAILAEPATGAKVDTYRTMIGHRLKMLGTADLERTVHDIVAVQMAYESSRFHKIMERISSDVTDKERKQFLSDRRSLWEKRIRVIYHL